MTTGYSASLVWTKQWHGIHFYDLPVPDDETLTDLL